LSIAMGSPIFFLPWPFTQFYLHPLIVCPQSLHVMRVPPAMFLVVVYMP